MDDARFGRFAPTTATRAGRMLAAGRLIATVTSRTTGRHVTLRFRAAQHFESGDGWPDSPFAEATHVFIEDYDGELLARYYPRSGLLKFERLATDAARWSVSAVLRYLSGAFPEFEKQAELMVADFCGKCGAPLTDPESLERGFGPTCYGEVTRSQAVAAAA